MADAQSAEQIERHNSSAREQVAKGYAISGRDVRSLNRGIDFVVGDVNHAVVLGARGSALFVFFSKMESSPQTAIRFAVAIESNFLGKSTRDAKRIHQIDKLVKALALYENIEEARI